MIEAYHGTASFPFEMGEYDRWRRRLWMIGVERLLAVVIDVIGSNYWRTAMNISEKFLQSIKNAPKSMEISTGPPSNGGASSGALMYCAALRIFRNCHFMFLRVKTRMTARTFPVVFRCSKAEKESHFPATMGLIMSMLWQTSNVTSIMQPLPASAGVIASRSMTTRR